MDLDSNVLNQHGIFCDDTMAELFLFYKDVWLILIFFPNNWCLLIYWSQCAT